MRIRMKTRYANGARAIEPDQVGDLPDEEALDLIDRGYALPVDEDPSHGGEAPAKKAAPAAKKAAPAKKTAPGGKTPDAGGADNTPDGDGAGDGSGTGDGQGAGGN